MLTHTTVIATIVTPWHRALLQDAFILTSAGADNLVLADDRHNPRPPVRLPETLDPSHDPDPTITTFVGISLDDHDSKLTQPY